MKNQQSLAKTLVALHLLLTPFVLAVVAHSVVTSPSFDGFIQLKIGRDGGEVLIDRRTATFLPDAEK